MKRLKIFGLVVAALVAVAVTVAAVWPSDEPSWQGKKLTEWLERLQESSVASPYKYDEEPYKAIRAVGTNGLPTIIRLLDTEDGAVKAKLIGLVNGQRLIHVHVKTDFEKQLAGMMGLGVLGSNALPIVPHLLKLWQHSKRSMISSLVSCQFSTVAPEPGVLLHTLENCFTNTDREIKRGAAELLQLNFPQEAERLGVVKAFPDLLIRVTNRPVVEVREVVK